MLIPVRHNMTPTEVSARSPLVGSIRSLSTEASIPVLAEEISMTIRRSWLYFASLEVRVPAMKPSEAKIAHERLSELRLAVTEELNELTAAYIVKYMEDPQFDRVLSSSNVCLCSPIEYGTCSPQRRSPRSKR